jgi:hypothetical protein
LWLAVALVVEILVVVPAAAEVLVVYLLVFLA